jgi:integrase
VPILDEIKPLLRQHTAREKEKHLRLGVPFTGGSILFSSHGCGYRSRYDVRAMLGRLCKRLGVPKTTLHSLRHTFCTILAKQGVPLKTASELMGHSNISITARIYTHVDAAERKKGIDKLSVYFEQFNTFLHKFSITA